MRSTHPVLLMLAAALLTPAGCSQDEHLRQPKVQHEYVLPPDDPRYSKPPQFPKNTLNDFPRKETTVDPDMPMRGPRGPGRFGAGGPGY